MLNRYEPLILAGLASTALLIACDASPEERTDVLAQLGGEGDDVVASLRLGQLVEWRDGLVCWIRWG